MKSRYFTKGYLKSLEFLFSKGVDVIDISVHSSGTITTRPRMESFYKKREAKK